MKRARPFLAAALAALSMWLLAGLWHTVVMVTFYTERTHAEHDGVGLILVAYLVLAGLMTWVFRRRRPERPAREGLLVGALVGVLWVFPHELAMAGAHGGSVLYVLQNGAWHVVEQGIGGAILGAVHGEP